MGGYCCTIFSFTNIAKVTLAQLPLQTGICSYCIIPFWLNTCVIYRYIYNCPSNLKSKYHPELGQCSFLNRFPGMVLFLLCIFENQQGNRYLKLMWSHNKIWRINANVKRKKYYKYNDKVWKQIIWVYFVSLPIIQKKLNLSKLRLLLRSDWHWNSMATLRQACRRWPLRKLGVSEKSGLFSNCSTENACAVSACAFSSLSKLHQTADQPRGETERFW